MGCVFQKFWHIYHLLWNKSPRANGPAGPSGSAGLGVSGHRSLRRPIFSIRQFRLLSCRARLIAPVEGKVSSRAFCRRNRSRFFSSGERDFHEPASQASFVSKKNICATMVPKSCCCITLGLMYTAKRLFQRKNRRARRDFRGPGFADCRKIRLYVEKWCGNLRSGRVNGSLDGFRAYFCVIRSLKSPSALTGCGVRKHNRKPTHDFEKKKHHRGNALPAPKPDFYPGRILRRGGIGVFLPKALCVFCNSFISIMLIVKAVV